MKKKKLLFITLAIFILGLLGWLHWRSQTLPRAASPAAKARKITDPLTAEEIQAINSANITALAKQRTLADPVIARQYLQALKDGKTDIATLLSPLNLAPEYKQALQDDSDTARVLMPLLNAVSGLNSQLINVYGKVVDQNGQPVAGAVVKGGTLLMVTPDQSGGDEFTTQTDDQGQFSFTGLHGARFGLGIEKSGYEYDPKAYLTWWNTYKPDPNNPMVFTMYKLQGAEPTINDDKFWGIIPDGRTYTIDLIKSKKAEDAAAEGDLRVSIERPADATRGQKFDWSFSIEAVDGGIVETHDPYLNEAPESGYQDSYTFTMSASDPNWQEGVQNKIFYIKSRDGQVYGYIKVEVIPLYQTTATFSVQSLVNPAGSRNLELDETKSVKAGSRQAQLVSVSSLAQCGVQF